MMVANPQRFFGGAGGGGAVTGADAGAESMAGAAGAGGRACG